MQQFLFLFVGAELKPGDGSPETQEYMRKWGEWVSSLTQRGALQSGGPLEWTGKSVTQDATDELQLQPVDIGGYMIISAESMEAAAGIARQAPNVALEGRIIIRPCQEPPT
jgi:hypothetical protein